MGWIQVFLICEELGEAHAVLRNREQEDAISSQPTFKGLGADVSLHTTLSHVLS